MYQNNEWEYSYREIDPLGGYDPYSSSKAAAEIAISSWRSSFNESYSNTNKAFLVSSARAGNVIGGGDWSNDRIIPDTIRALKNQSAVNIRNPNATRPWQHVLEPLVGYLILAEKLYRHGSSYSTAFNFGPNNESNQNVQTLIKESLTIWPGNWIINEDKRNPHEANLLKLNYDKAFKELNWSPRWNFKKTIYKTISWYKKFYNGKSAIECCMNDIQSYFAK